MKCICRPFYSVYNYLSTQTSRFFNFIANKVHTLAMNIFTHYLTACKDLVFQKEIKQLQQTKDAINELKPHFTNLSAQLKELAQNLNVLPDALTTSLQEKLPQIPLDPLQGPTILNTLKEQIERAQKTVDATASMFDNLFSEDHQPHL